MAADEEIAGHEIAGEDVNPNPVLPATDDPADTCDAYAELEYAGECVPPVSAMYPDFPEEAIIEGDTCDAYAEIEFAGECVNENAVFQSLPTSSIEEFDTSAGRLGCGVPTVFITSRCSQSMACQIDLSDIIRITWTRVLDDVSEAEVEVGLTGDSQQTCCQCLATVEPFCHELHIWRDGDEVWVGPIEAIRYERERVTIKARDSLAWLDVRIPNEDVEFSAVGTAGTITDNPLTAIATTFNSAALATLPAIAGAIPRYYVVFEPDNPENRDYALIITHGGGATSATITRNALPATISGSKAHVVNSAWRVQGVVEVDNPWLAGSTTLNGAGGMSDLPVVTLVSGDPTPAIFLVMEGDNLSQREVIQIQTHGAGATSAIVIRGQYGTTAQNHPSSSVWVAGSLSGPPEDLTYLAKNIIFLAFQEDIDIGNDCEFFNMFTTETGEVIEFFKEKFNETYLEILMALATTELNVTTLGRTIVITGDSLAMTPLILLNDEHIMGNIEVTKDGKLMANRIWLHWEGDQGIPAVGQKEVSDRFCYSLVERISDGNGLALDIDASDTAEKMVNAAFIAPKIIDIPEGSRLSPDTPWTINQMVPGARIDVAITRLCLNLTQSFLLTGVTVDYSESDGEAVGITLRPMNSVGGV